MNQPPAAPEPIAPRLVAIVAPSGITFAAATGKGNLTVSDPVIVAPDMAPQVAPLASLGPMHVPEIPQLPIAVFNGEKDKTSSEYEALSEYCT